MNSTLKKLLALVLALAMVVAIVACKPADDQKGTPDPVEPGTTGEVQPPVEDENDSTLVVGYSYFSEKFSTFFAKTAYDSDVAAMTGVNVIEGDREGNMVLNGIEGETRSYNGTDYTYKGIADMDVVQNTDGTVDYNVTLREDLVFSDGTPMTIDDLIFSLYVVSDPTYDGSATFYSLPVTGMTEYRASMMPLWTLIHEAGEENAEFTKWTEDQQKQYWEAFYAAGEKFVLAIVDYCVAAGYADGTADDTTKLTEALAAWGYDPIDDPTPLNYFKVFIENFGYDLSDKGINYESAGASISDLIIEALGADAATFTAGVNVGEAVPNIAGIVKTGDYSMTVHCDKFEASSIYQFATTVAPLHYYGDPSKYDYENNMFGFTKGDLSGVKAKTTVPMGAGPYKFLSYENGVVTFEANENYWKGQPKIKYLLFQETADGDKLSGVASGTFDITDPSFSTDVVEAIKGYNSNGELVGDVITTNTVDNLGYGYIGLCAYNVKVGEDGGSAESKLLRRGLATLLAVYRDTVVYSYYGDRASVIQYPISNTSWAAPKPNDEGYELAYSTDVEGNPIYTDGMTEQERYDAALQATIGFLKAAGYTFDEATGLFTAAPAGAEMSYEAIIPADGVGDHPAYGILTAVKDALATIGITLEINDPTDSNVLWNAIEAVPSTADLWCAAWQSTVDPDMYQVYYSTNINGAGGTDSNHYYVTDDTLDELIIEARSSADLSFRKATYKQALEIILDWAVEVPTYQRQNALIFSTENVNLDTLTPDITTFWGWAQDIELLEVN